MKLFKRKSKNHKKPINYFRIIHYPLTERYYPMYKGLYLTKSYGTGIMRTEDYFPCADYGKTLEDAKKLINLFKEHQLKENISTIYLDED